ncbi:MAG: Flp pilus assembly complex ATPase component TadA [Firmicutes bacterium]|nr:Flp pilus assembly complex ATPase component TadA [Bacillota bacterium]
MVKNSPALSDKSNILGNLRFLPQDLLEALRSLDLEKLQEIRIRADKPVMVLIDGRFIKLSAAQSFQSSLNKNQQTQTAQPQAAITASNWANQSYFKRITPAINTSSFSHQSPNTPSVSIIKNNLNKTGDSVSANSSICQHDRFIKCNQAQIAQIVLRAAEFSIYAYNNQISSGYITIAGGIRIGIAGEIVYDKDKIKTQKNISSLVIRIPHQIKGCANRVFSRINHAKNKNTLVISPPGAGKTTLLRDLARQVADAGHNTLLVDERSELAACVGGVAQLDIGECADIISGAKKDYAFSFGIRSLRPSFIFTDELGGRDDIDAIVQAACSGVSVIASVHADGIEGLKARSEFDKLFLNKIFGTYIVLSLRRGAGTYEKILDENFVQI